MKKSLWIFAFTFALAASAFLASCGGDETSDDESDGDEPHFELDGDIDGDSAEADGEGLDIVDGDDDGAEESVDGDGVEDEISPDGDTAEDEIEIESDGDDTVDGDGPGPNCPMMLVEGLNQGFNVNGADRAFLLNLPDDAGSSGPWPVIFNWHGYGDTASNMAGLLKNSVNNSIMPFILVTPDDTNIQLPSGVDWDTLKVYPDNKEVALYDAILNCLDWQYGVDENHIHSIGFSAGSIMTDALATLRSDELASVLTWSGGYFANAANVQLLDAIVRGYVSWPAYSATNKYAQVLISGGTEDKFGGSMMGFTMWIHFDQMAENDETWLNQNGHDVISCKHTQGHTAPAGFSPENAIKFFHDHPKGTVDSPYSSALPDSFPDWCYFSGKTN